MISKEEADNPKQQRDLITVAGIPPGRYGVQPKAQTLFPPPTDAASLMVGARFPYRNNNRLPN